MNHLIRQATTDPEQLAKKRGLPFNPAMLKEWRSTPRLFGYIAPFYTQAKGIAWDMFKYFSQKIPGTTINEAELRIDLPGFGRIRLFGADNPQSLRGLKFWEVVFDEWQDIDPNVFTEIVSPACIDTQAPVSFSGTIKGEDHLWEMYEKRINDPEWFCLKLKASESGIIPTEWLEKERLLIGDAKFNQEYELEPMAAIEGSYYMRELTDLLNTNRFTHVPYEPLLTVDTYWDLGMDDTMFVLFVQRDLNSVRVIDSYWAHGEPLKDIAKTIREKSYIYGTHKLPHDGKVRSMDTGEERYKSLERYLPGQKVECLPRPKTVMDKVEASRYILPKVWMDKEKCEYLKRCLAYYRQEFDEKSKTWKGVPTHDWSSHGADAFAYMALDLRGEIFNSLPTRSSKVIDDYINLPPDEFRM